MTLQIAPLPQYDEENESQFRQLIERALARLHAKDGDIELGFADQSFRLIFTNASGTRIAVGLDANSNLTATDVETGNSVVIIEYASISDAPQSLAELDPTAASSLSSVVALSATNAAGITTNATAIANETTARATAITATEASLRGEAQRPNLIPVEYQLFGEDEDLDFISFGAAKSATGIDNDLLQRDAQRFATNGSTDFVRIRVPTTMTLPPGRYGYRIRLRTSTSSGSVSSVRARILDGSDSSFVTQSIVSSGLLNDTNYDVVGTIDLSSEARSLYLFELGVIYSTVASDNFIWPMAFQIERLPDGVTEPGPFVAPNEQGRSSFATTRILQDAFVDSNGNAFAGIQLVADAGGGAPKTVELFDTESGGGIRLGGDTEIDGNLMVTGTIQTGAHVVGAISNRVTDINDADVAFGSGWITVADATIVSTGGKIQVLGQFEVFASTGIAGGSVVVNARLVRDGSTIVRTTRVGSSQTQTNYEPGVGNVEQPTVFRGTAVLMDEDEPAAGSRRYRLQVRVETSTHSGIASDRFLAVREFKTE